MLDAASVKTTNSGRSQHLTLSRTSWLPSIESTLTTRPGHQEEKDCCVNCRCHLTVWPGDPVPIPVPIPSPGKRIGTRSAFLSQGWDRPAFRFPDHHPLRLTLQLRG